MLDKTPAENASSEAVDKQEHPKNRTRQAWRRPLLSRFGSVEDITRGSGNMSPTDPGVQPCCSGVP